MLKKHRTNKQKKDVHAGVGTNPKRKRVATSQDEDAVMAMMAIIWILNATFVIQRGQYV
jgi:hypothetical protein